jgi:hypothetical protein
VNVAENSPGFEYRALGCHVFVVRDESPEWWRLVATFGNEARAIDYADMENTFADDTSFDTPLGGRDDSKAPAPAVEPPKSALTTEALIRRESIAHTRIERTEEITRAAPAAVEPPPQTLIIQAPVIEAKPVAKTKRLIDASTLPPLTEGQAKVFRGLIAAVAERGERPSFSDISRHCGIAGIAHHLPNLASKGYIENRGEYGAPDWRPLAEGEPRIDLPTDSRGKAVRQWTEEEVQGLYDLKLENGDGYVAYAEKIDRTLDAVMQKARTMRCYNPKLSPFATVTVAEEPAQAAEPAAVAPQAVESPKKDDGPTHVDQDDLSKWPREVLCVIAELHADQVHPIKEPDIIPLVDLDESRLPFALNRLRELNCVRRDDVGSYFPTDRGKKIATDIRASEERETA